MENLDRFSSQELTFSEMKEINGGIVCGGACIAGALFVAAFVAGYAWGKDVAEN